MADHTNSPFLTSEVSKGNGRALNGLFQVNQYAGSIPRNASKFKLSGAIADAKKKKQGQLTSLVKPYKGQGAK